MFEIRKDYVTEKWVVIARDDSSVLSEIYDLRRSDFDPENCPFCPGNEDQTPPERLSYRSGDSKPNEPGWWVRCFPNKYPSLQYSGEASLRIEQIYSRMAGVGAHEVIVETPDHDRSIADLSEQQLREVINAYRDRYLELSKDDRFKFVIVFKNYGLEAGASVPHTHSQIIATPMIPSQIMDELRGADRYYQLQGGRCIFDSIIEYELEARERLVFETDRFVALCPFAASFPFETWILPKKHNPFFEQLSYEDRDDLATVLKKVLVAVTTRLKNPAFNMVIHTSPCDGGDYRFYHWHMGIMPRLLQVAGFEWGTGLYINHFSPERSARILRGEEEFTIEYKNEGECE